MEAINNIGNESMKVCVSMEDALCQSRWIMVLIRLLLVLGKSSHCHLLGILPDL